MKPMNDVTRDLMLLTMAQLIAANAGISLGVQTDLKNLAELLNSLNNLLRQAGHQMVSQ